MLVRWSRQNPHRSGLARGFAERGFKTIGIDADSSPNLGLTLGLSVEETRKIMPVSENKQLVEEKTSTGYAGVYNLNFTVDDIVKQYSVLTPLGVNLIVMGTVRSMGAGCMCAPTAVIRALLRYLVVETNEAVVLDLEAGVEHIGRALQGKSMLLIVADSNMKSLEIAKHINDLAFAQRHEAPLPHWKQSDERNTKTSHQTYADQNSLNLLMFVPFDQKSLNRYAGVTPLKNKDTEAVKTIDSICDILLRKPARTEF